MSEGFAHHLKLDRIRDGERFDLVAGEDELRAVAERLDLDSLPRFEAHVVISRDGERIGAKGRIAARLTQKCVANGDSVPAHVDEPFELLFVRDPGPARPDEEVELTEGDLDLIFHDGSEIDLGAALADTLALSLDPYPRSAGAEAVLREAGVISEEEAGPFAALAELKRRMESGES
jgi:uncharacterized metal-binding protein YceD (DUF177 family)